MLHKLRRVRNSRSARSVSLALYFSAAKSGHGGFHCIVRRFRDAPKQLARRRVLDALQFDIRPVLGYGKMRGQPGYNGWASALKTNCPAAREAVFQSPARRPAAQGNVKTHQPNVIAAAFS
jgi:hypothetical protein